MVIDGKNAPINGAKNIDDIYNAIFGLNKEEFIGQRAVNNLKNKEEYEK